MREEQKRIAGVDVVLTWPSRTQNTAVSKLAQALPPTTKGVTFLLPGAMVNISEYTSLRDIILQQDHLVVSMYMNVLWPFRNNHRTHAHNVKKVFDELTTLYTTADNCQLDASCKSYSLVGHSVGGKVALLVAATIDPNRVSAVLALDPVDMNPIEFTTQVKADSSNDKKKGRSNLSLITAGGTKTIFITCTKGGLGIPAAHNANAIHKFHSTATTLYEHNDAGHMAYCDNGGGMAGRIMPDVGTTEANQQARVAAHELIRQILNE